MKKHILFGGAILIALGASAQKKKKSDTPAVATYSDSISYAFGISLANNLKNQGVDSISFDAFYQGFKAFYENQNWLTNDQAQLFLKDFISKKQQIANENNRKAGEAFLANNKSKPGVITLPSGLQYKVINKGTGTVKPTLADKVKTHYHGTLIDGTVFDSSVDRGQPISFPVNGVIRGWVEILQMMVVGDKFEIYVPQDLAYGARGQSKIKPFSTLIFTVELLDIEK
ncbi:MAG TPA: FKBP-type peptidyl-prolyl cis-trans isomerase [Luteibaculaceae bacterium]|nr:FKBP-type peptidyl-prolyl cis-trans isomerase [Luteibaculaceae bacterium]